jgi:hypothetical protein
VGANEQQTTDFCRRSERALAYVVLHIERSQLYLVTDCEEPKDARDRSVAHFDRQTSANKLFLKKKFYRIQMKDGTKLNDHFKTIKELVDQLAAIGVTIDEENQVMALLGSLPESFDTIVTALETQEELTLTNCCTASVNQCGAEEAPSS